MAGPVDNKVRWGMTENTAEPVRLLSLLELMDILNLARTPCLRLIAREGLPVIRLSKRKLLFDPRDVAALIAKRRQAG